MALIVEDGTVVAGAEALVTVAYCDQYHSDRGNAAWAAIVTVAEKEQAIRRGNDYGIQKYRARWRGLRVSATQAQDFPRSGLEVAGYGIASTTIPEQVKQAFAELALRANTGDLNPDVEPLVTKEVIGPLAVTYDEFSSQAIEFSAVKELLAPFLNGSSGINRKLSR